MFNIFKKKIVSEVGGEGNIPKAFIIIGRSGCGKGTQADLLMTHLLNKQHKISKTIHIESGKLLRAFSTGSSYTEQKTKIAIESGTLAPEAIIVSLWMKKIMAEFTGVENMVFDGCPRKLRESKLLNDTLEFYKINKPNVIYINVNNEWSEKRLMERGRKDDTPESIKKRLNWYETDVVPVINYYKENSFYNFIEINGEQTIPEVQKEILAKLGLNL